MRVLWLGLLVVALAPAAFAQTATEAVPPATPAAAVPSPPTDSGTYSLAWVRDEGAESCPTGRELAQDVTQRLGRSPFDNASSRSIEIRVERTATGFRSRVHVRAADGSVLGRRMLSSDEPSCAPLFSATALAVALLIDPDAAERGASNLPGPVAEFVVPEPPPAPTAPPPPRAEVTQPRPPAAAPSSPEADRDVASASALGGFAVGLTPEGSPAVALNFSGHPSVHWGWSVTALYVDPSEVVVGNAAFSVGLTAAGAAATFRPLTRGAILVFDAGPWLGVLGTSVLAPPGDQPTVVATSPGDLTFLALSAGVGVEVRVTKQLFVAARGSLLVPLIRHQLMISEDSSGLALNPVWTQPVAAGLFSAGVGLAFF